MWHFLGFSQGVSTFLTVKKYDVICFAREKQLFSRTFRIDSTYIVNFGLGSGAEECLQISCDNPFNGLSQCHLNLSFQGVLIFKISASQ
jgi:hypothetical protein